MASRRTVTDVMQEVSDWSEVDPEGTMTGVPDTYTLEEAALWLESQNAAEAFVFDEEMQLLGKVNRADLLVGPEGFEIPMAPAAPEIPMAPAADVAYDAAKETDWVLVCQKKENHKPKPPQLPFEPSRHPCSEKGEPEKWRCPTFVCQKCELIKVKRED